MSYKVRLVLMFPVCLAVLVGCGKGGPTPSSLKGKVLYKGEPVTGGMITFYGKDMGAYPVQINPDGTYEKSGLPTGELTVCVETETLNPTRPSMGNYGGPKGKNMGDSTPEAMKNQPSDKGKYVKIPRKYSTPKDSDLKVTLDKGENLKDLELKD
jgi:hypothetical protein